MCVKYVSVLHPCSPSIPNPQIDDTNKIPFVWKKSVLYVLTLEHPSGSNLGLAKRNPDNTYKLYPKAINWVHVP